ncbi:MAG: agmatine deiminase family protein [Planctomycetota bacterium]
MPRQFGSPIVLLVCLEFLLIAPPADAQWFRRRWSRPAYRPTYTPQPIRNPSHAPPTTRRDAAATPKAPARRSSQPDISDRTSPTTSGSEKLAKIRVPGEFEPQRAMMLSISDWMPHHFDILTQITEATDGHVELIVFYNDLGRVKQVVEHLMKAGIDGSHVFFSPLELDTIWVRDFAPRLAETADGPIALDFFYEGSRPKDDAFPVRWAETCQSKLRTVRWTIQGGNLLFNGRGLGVTSERIFKDNAIGFPPSSSVVNPQVEARRMVTDQFKRACNLSELVVLERLSNEVTGHVDMFMTFVAPDHVVVGRLDPRRNPINARILDRNAARLARIWVGSSPMQVTRVDFPTPNGKQWSSMTNVILANDLILLPRIDTDPPEILAAAKAMYQRVLPGYSVEMIDMTSMKALQGAIHCISMNVPEFATLPEKRYAYTEFRRQLETSR